MPVNFTDVAFPCDCDTQEQSGSPIAGANGLSAYEVAVEDGFVGTETEWLVSLRGPQGEQGPAGNSFNLKGVVTSVAELPATADAADAYWVGSQGSLKLYLYSGSEWMESPELVGPQGPPGPPAAVNWSNATAADIHDAVIQILKDEGLIQ